MAKNSEVIEKVLNHQIQIILSLQLHQFHLLKYLKKGIISPNKWIKSPKIITQSKQITKKNKTKKNKNNFEVDTSVDDETDNHLLLIKTKTSNDKNNKLSTRKRIKVETKSNQFVKKVVVIESSSKL